MEESGCVLEHPKATSFRTHVIEGCWSEVRTAISCVTVSEDCCSCNVATSTHIVLFGLAF